MFIFFSLLLVFINLYYYCFILCFDNGSIGPTLPLILRYFNYALLIINYIIFYLCVCVFDLVFVFCIIYHHQQVFSVVALVIVIVVVAVVVIVVVVVCCCSCPPLLFLLLPAQRSIVAASFASATSKDANTITEPAHCPPPTNKAKKDARVIIVVAHCLVPSALRLSVWPHL